MRLLPQTNYRYNAQMKVKAWVLACGLAVCLLTQTAVAGPIEDANSVYARKDYTAAFHQFKCQFALNSDPHFASNSNPFIRGVR